MLGGFPPGAGAEGGSRGLRYRGVWGRLHAEGLMSCGRSQPVPRVPLPQGWSGMRWGTVGPGLGGSGIGCTRLGAGTEPRPVPPNPVGDPGVFEALLGPLRSAYLRCFLRSRAGGAGSAGGKTEAGRGTECRARSCSRGRSPAPRPPVVCALSSQRRGFGGERCPPC